MTIEEAIEVLELHNQWRNGAEIPMESPARIGMAIDLVVCMAKDAVAAKQPTDILKLANAIQADCHAAVESIRADTKGCSYADAVNVWLFRKLAALEIRLRQMDAVKKMNEETNV